MEAKNADLSALRIDRAADPAAPTPGARRWLVIGLPVAGVVVLAAVLLATSGALGSAVPVRLTPATTLGVALAALLSFERISVVNFQSFSEIGFGFALSPGVIARALVFAVVMGVVGGFLPAARAARLNIVNALRAS